MLVVACFKVGNGPEFLYGSVKDMPILTPVFWGFGFPDLQLRIITFRAADDKLFSRFFVYLVDNPKAEDFCLIYNDNSVIDF